MKIKEQLNTYISENGIKQIYIAQKTGLTADTVSKMLNGSRRILADEFLLICNALNIDPNIFRNRTS
ncbi:MAG: helix-turn-helix transcriptional regulator [Ruminococcaceae bacterium]|nr:helix-turn-helix transcriptional regulator [Oscillospiraceae bacterium]